MLNYGKSLLIIATATAAVALSTSVASAATLAYTTTGTFFNSSSVNVGSAITVWGVDAILCGDVRKQQFIYCGREPRLILHRSFLASARFH